MKSLLFILSFSYSQLLIGQIKVGNYSKNDTTNSVTLKLFKDSSYDFYYSYGHCSSWGHYTGKWEQKNDTLILNYIDRWTEKYDSIITETNFNNDSVFIKLMYDDGNPIRNIPLNLSCTFDKKYSKTFFQIAMDKSLFLTMENL